ncbi:MAG TPA: hypothetical protein VK139_04880 [Microbacteriaceae bacterium]|nr:hypothetical protein [Microbacteriaceae bacterium]
MLAFTISAFDALAVAYLLANSARNEHWANQHHHTLAQQIRFYLLTAGLLVIVNVVTFFARSIFPS